MKSYEIHYTPRNIPTIVLQQLVKVATVGHIHYNFPSKEFVILNIKELDTCLTQ